MSTIIKLLLSFTIVAMCVTCVLKNQNSEKAIQKLLVSANQRYLQYENGAPFFWLGDTGWLLFQKLSREEADLYLEDRCEKGFNVVQTMLIHELPETNYYGDSAFIDKNPTKPNITAGSSYQDSNEYDYWDHVDYIVDLARGKGIYIAMVPIWGSTAKNITNNGNWARIYALWLVKRYKDKPNIIWLNGGDIRGDNMTEIWQQIGRTLDEHDPNHLISFHPFGRTQSSTWFHDASWLDFNMFQSGHRRYDQRRETDDVKNWKGEDNWKYVVEDYSLTPIKPTIDGEPSYENIPQGLHDSNEPYWTAADVRRYAYWSVFAGSFGHTYGNNSVMQMHKPNSGKGAYGVCNFWYEAINDTAAGQMQYLKRLILSFPFFERVPDQSLLAGHNGLKYDYVIATRGKKYAMFYTYTGRSFDVFMNKINSKKIKADWFNPRNGEYIFIDWFENSENRQFDPPGNESPGNDWVLILKDEDLYLNK